jgi:hypothetical protein
LLTARSFRSEILLPLVAPKPHLIATKLGGYGRRVYIGLMRSALTSLTWLPLLAAWAMAWPVAAGAQAFTADYELRVAPALQADARFSGAGLSVTAGKNWFGQVAVGRSLQQAPQLAGTSADALSIAGGYQWSNGQALSLQITGSRGADRLGLSINYDWPRYFVRLSYDSRFDLKPVETLRFSAGMKF